MGHTGHDRHAAEDYHILNSLGIAVAREGIPWPTVDRGGSYDFSIIDPFIDAMNASKITPIRDLCHYGYPDDLDPFSDAFVRRFAQYCRAAAAYVLPKVRGPHFFTPINEITFFSFCAGEWGWAAPGWLRDVMGESLAAVRRGIDLQGIRLFPAVDMPDWHTGEWVHNGICDLVEVDGDLSRVPNPAYVDELRRWQKELNRVTELDEDPPSDPVELQDVVDAAHRLDMQPDKDWS